MKGRPGEAPTIEQAANNVTYVRVTTGQHIGRRKEMRRISCQEMQRTAREWQPLPAPGAQYADFSHTDDRESAAHARAYPCIPARIPAGLQGCDGCPREWYSVGRVRVARVHTPRVHMLSPYIDARAHVRAAALV
jgi:hypothetical protein